jgi:hypothetical protein
MDEEYEVHDGTRHENEASRGATAVMMLSYSRGSGPSTNEDQCCLERLEKRT